MVGRDSKRIAVIGSGISGLSCAYLLHKAGKEVTLYESEATFGGHTLTGDHSDAPFDCGRSHAEKIKNVTLEACR
jgi:predicted NAD/FAD-binding protein